MSTTTQAPTLIRTRVEWASVPRVNLLPAEIVEGRRLRKTQVRLAAVVACVVLGGLGATAWAQYQVSVARTEQAGVQARTSQLQAEAATYAEVPRVLAEVDAVSAARERAMAADVLWYRFLDELAVATPSTVSLTSLEMSMSAANGAVATQDALTRADLGDVTISGDATRIPDVAAWLTAVGTVHGLDVSRLQSAVRSEAAGGTSSGVKFASAVGVTENALSHRYDRKGG